MTAVSNTAVGVGTIHGSQSVRFQSLRLGCYERASSVQCSLVTRRPELERALDYLREGDTLIVTKPDRLARSTADLLATAKHLADKGITLRILSMNFDTSTATGKLLMTMLAGIAEFERDLMLERQREGIAKAKADGKYKGRKATAMAKAGDVARLRADGKTAPEIARELGISRASVFRALAAAT